MFWKNIPQKYMVDFLQCCFLLSFILGLKGAQHIIMQNSTPHSHLLFPQECHSVCVVNLKNTQ